MPLPKTSVEVNKTTNMTPVNGTSAPEDNCAEDIAVDARLKSRIPFNTFFSNYKEVCLDGHGWEFIRICLVFFPKILGILVCGCSNITPSAANYTPYHHSIEYLDRTIAGDFCVDRGGQLMPLQWRG